MGTRYEATLQVNWSGARFGLRLPRVIRAIIETSAAENFLPSVASLAIGIAFYDDYFGLEIVVTDHLGDVPDEVIAGRFASAYEEIRSGVRVPRVRPDIVLSVDKPATVNLPCLKIGANELAIACSSASDLPAAQRFLAAVVAYIESHESQPSDAR